MSITIYFYIPYGTSGYTSPGKINVNVQCVGEVLENNGFLANSYVYAPTSSSISFDMYDNPASGNYEFSSHLGVGCPVIFYAITDAIGNVIVDPVCSIIEDDYKEFRLII